MKIHGIEQNLCYSFNSPIFQPFLDWTNEYLDYYVKSGGLTIYSTQNTEYQKILEEEVKNEVVNIKCNHDKEQEVVPLENILAHIENHLSGGHEHE